MLSRAGFLHLAALFAVTTPVFAQTTPSAANPGSSPSAQTKAVQNAPAPVATLKAAAQLVVVDVVATDSSQRPIHGLKASDFALTESGIPQVIKNFEEHTAPTTADATKFAAMPALPPGIFTNFTPTPANGAVNLILLDTLNTPMRDQSYVRQQFLAYLKATPPGTRIAIFGLTTRLILLQGFTSDPELLRRVMEKGRSKGSPLLDDQVGGGGIQNSQADTLEDMEIPGTEEMVANMRQFEAQQQSFQLQLRAKYTLDAMSQIAHYVAAIPGRKNLIWFSGSFPIDVLPDTTGNLPDPFAAMASSEDEFRDTVSLLARSQVAVYPIDARGLFNSPVMDASTSKNYGGARGIARMNQDQSKFFNDTASEQITMREMADSTGGHAFVNTNGLTKAVATAVEDGSNFYTISYTPTNPDRDGKLRKISVHVNRSGINLAYRKGYYADDPAKLKSFAVKPDAAIASTTAPTPSDTLRLAMTRGAPTPTEILIKVGVVPMTSGVQTEDAPATGNRVTEKARGPYRRYSVNYAINPGDLIFLRTGDGKIHTDFDLVIFVFNADGELINSLGNSVHLAGSLEEIKKMIAQGILCHEEVSAPAKGEYFLRIAVHDLRRDHYGAVEVATADVRNVKPVILPAPAEPAAGKDPAGATK